MTKIKASDIPQNAIKVKKQQTALETLMDQNKPNSHSEELNIEHANHELRGG